MEAPLEYVVHRDGRFERLYRATGLLVVSLVSLLCLMLVVRRLGGALTSSLGGAEFVAVAVIGLLGSGLFRLMWRTNDRPQSRSAQSRSTMLVGLAVPSLCFGSCVAALTMPGTPLWARVGVWVTVFASEGAWWLVGINNFRVATAATTTDSNSLGGESVSDQRTAESGEDAEPTLPQEVTQQLTRSTGPQNADSLYGLVRTSLGVGERSAQVHIAFCPPFSGQPTLRAFVIEGRDASIKVAQLESFGTRLEVRLANHAQQPEQVLVEFEARHEPPDPPAEHMASPVQL